MFNIFYCLTNSLLILTEEKLLNYDDTAVIAVIGRNLLEVSFVAAVKGLYKFFEIKLLLFVTIMLFLLVLLINLSV